MEHQLNLRNFKKKEIHRLSDRFYGKSEDGKELSFNNYYMEMNGNPFFGISGECHYSRVSEDQWEDPENEDGRDQYPGSLCILDPS